MNPAVGSVSVSLRDEDGVVREKKWAAGAPDLGIARTVPWRTFRWRHGQQHYSGTYWSSVMRGDVIYESRLELTRLLYADFDRGTEAVFAQPFLLSAQVDGRQRRHVPDFLILRRGRVPLVVDVKPRHLLTDLGTPLSARHRLRAGVLAEVRGAGTRELPRPAADSGDADTGTPEDGKAGAYMGQAGVRVGVGTRFAYDGEVVTVVEMFASAHGNELLVRDGRDRRFRL